MDNLAQLSLFCHHCASYLGRVARCDQCGQPHTVADSSWQQPGTEAARPVALVGPAVIVCDAGQGVLMAHAWHDGTPLWSRPVHFPWPLQSSCVVTGGRIQVVARDTGVVAAVACESGQIVWQYTLPDSGEPGEPARVGSLLAVGNSSGKLFLLQDRGDHAVLEGRFSLPHAIRRAPVDRGSLLLTATSHTQGALYALDLRHRRQEPLWHLAFPRARIRHVVADGRCLLIITERPQAAWLHCHDAESRQARWSLPLPAEGGAAWLPPVVAGGKVVVVNRDGTLCAFGQDSGEMVWREAVAGGRVTGCVAWRDLLFVSGGDGLLTVDLASGRPEEHMTESGGVVAAPVQDRLGNLCLATGDGRLVRRPWHNGKWPQAAARATAWGQDDLAATFACLAGEPEQAASGWARAGHPERGAALWQRLGEREWAAEGWEAAAHRMRTIDPPRAAAWLNHAAAQYEALSQPAQAARCRQQAGALGQFSHLMLQVLNVPDMEAEVGGMVTLRLHNRGNAAAREIRLEAGGTLAHLAEVQVGDPLAPGSALRIELGVVPLRPGGQLLTLHLTWHDNRGKPAEERCEVALHVTEAPHVRVGGDAGGVVIDVAEGGQMPRVRISGDAGLVRYQVRARSGR